MVDLRNDNINLFYKEPDSDRWLPYDRYFREVVRKFLYRTGLRKRRPSGHRMVYQNLKKGLSRIGVSYRDNRFSFAQRNPDALMSIIGKPYLLYEYDWPNPVVFGASIFSHPVDHPDFFDHYPNVGKMLVPGPWMYDMFAEHYPGDRLAMWPVGIDTDDWKPERSQADKANRILLYDKVRWDHDRYEQILISPVRRYVEGQEIELETIRYGNYYPDDLKSSLRRCQAVIFLCEHETQGLAYQQMLASGVPIFAWDRGGYWQDPSYFPNRVRYGPVTSVPYWDNRCGMKFKNLQAFKNRFGEFWEKVQNNEFQPRAYILDNLTLEKCARKYVSIVKKSY